MIKRNQFSLNSLLSKFFISFLTFGTLLTNVIVAEEKSSMQIQDGTKIVQDKDGSLIQIKPDGTKTIKKADGTSIEIKPDGTKFIYNPDGTSIEVKPDGTKIIKR